MKGLTKTERRYIEIVKETDYEEDAEYIAKWHDVYICALQVCINRIETLENRIEVLENTIRGEESDC